MRSDAIIREVVGAPRSAGARSGPPPATLVAPQAGLLTLLSSCLPPFLAASSCSFSPRPTGKQPHCSLPSCLSSKQPSLAFCNALILSLLMRRKSIHKRSKGGSKSCPWCPGPVLPLPWQSLAVPMESSLPPPPDSTLHGPFLPVPHVGPEDPQGQRQSGRWKHRWEGELPGLGRCRLTRGQSHNIRGQSGHPGTAARVPGSTTFLEATELCWGIQSPGRRNPSPTWWALLATLRNCLPSLCVCSRESRGLQFDRI